MHTDIRLKVGARHLDQALASEMPEVLTSAICPLAMAGTEHFGLTCQATTSFLHAGGETPGSKVIYVAQAGKSRDLHNLIIRAFDESNTDLLLELLEQDLEIVYIRPLIVVGGKDAK